MNSREAWVLLLFHLACTYVPLIRGSEKRFVRKDQELIDNLQNYEIIRPQLSENQSAKTPAEPKLQTLSFSFQGKSLTLKLSENRNLFSPKYFERHVAPNGSEVITKNSDFCFFHGHVEGHETESVAAIATCDGIDGYFTLLNKTYLIQPVKSVSGALFHIIFESEHVRGPRYKCGHTRHKPPEVILSKASHRVRRDVLTETKYVEMVIVNDHSQCKKYGENTTLRTKILANIVDCVYRVHNIRIVLIHVDLWENGNRITVESNEQNTLTNFEKYKETVLDKNEDTKNDNAQLLTQQKFNGIIVGKASHLSICSPSSSSIVQDHSNTAGLTASTMAHELGHNFGLDHDEGFCQCGKTEGCLMASTLRYTPLFKLSNCSQKTLKNTLLSNYGTCLFDQPTKHERLAKCGNAFIDEGEQCDCGGKEHCELAENHCCNYTICHLYPGSQCSDGPCCENCQLKPRGAVCREKVNDCDLPEYCNGKSPLCAPDAYVHNGRPCGNDKTGRSVCNLGVCHTHESQCKNFWGPKGTKANDNCYLYLNVLADKWGHCRKLGNNKYQKCEKKDVLCGKLQCEITSKGSGPMPIIGTKREAHSKTLGHWKCWSGVVYMGDDIPEPGMVQTGTMCGPNKVCSNSTCVDVDVAFPQPNCPKNCSGNGICNNLGHCHCNYGYQCPDCTETCSGEGGSVDSGNGCDCPDANATMSTPLATTNPPSTTYNTTLSTSVVTTEAPTRGENFTTPVSKPRTNVKTATEETTASTEEIRTTEQKNEETTGYTTEEIKTTEYEEGETGTTSETLTGGKDTSSGAEASTIALAIVVPVLVLFVVFLCILFRKQIAFKLRKVRKPPQQSFPPINYVRERRSSFSSQENLTETDVGRGRPSKLELGIAVPDQVVVTPDRSPEKKQKRLATPVTPIAKELKQLTPDSGEPKVSPNRPEPPRFPPRPGAPPRPMGPKNKSLPDLLEGRPSAERPSLSPLPNKAQSFNAVDKPVRPKVPKVPRIPTRQASNVERGTKANVGQFPKPSPSAPTRKPGSSSQGQTPGNPKPGSGAPRQFSEGSPLDNTRPIVEHTFRPSDIKAGKSPFGFSQL